MTIKAIGLEELNVTSKDSPNSTDVVKEIPFDIDVGNLAVVDINSFPEKKAKNIANHPDLLKSFARDAVQSIVNSVFALPRETVDHNEYAVMPPPATVLPREKAIPKPKPLTKWEQYCKEKGIKKRKKETKVWDEVAKDFVPRYGKHKVQLNKEQNWVMEVPRQADPFEDQFSKAANAKKERIAKNEYQRLRNLSRAKKADAPGVGVVRTDTRDVGQLQKAMHFSKLSTVSLGKYQPSLKGEKEIKGFKKNSRTSEDKPFIGKMKDERNKSLKIISRMNRVGVNTETKVIKEIEQKMTQDEYAERREINRTGRRSKLGGRKNKKSGAALATLTEGKMGDRKSLKRYNKQKAANDEANGKAPAAGKRRKKKASAFGGEMGSRAVKGRKRSKK